MPMDRRIFMIRSAAATAAVAAGASVRADTFPVRTVTLVVPFPPGGNIDIVGRGLAVPLARELGQPVIVDNRGGGGGAVGATAVARAAPDGYTLMVGTPGQIVTVPAMIKTPYSASSFRPVGMASRTSVVIVARKADTRFKNFKDLVALARSNPGMLSAAHAGPGTPNHLALLQLENLLQLKFNIVSYRGSGPALVDVLGGQVDLCSDQVTSSMAHIKSGALQALAVLGPQPDPALPGVPTLGQLGLAEFDATTYTGVFAPSQVPANVMATLIAAVDRAARNPQFAATLRELGSIATPGSPEDFSRIVDAEAALAAQLVRQGRLKAE